MARPRKQKPKSGSPKKGRVRDYAAEYRRRCELAEAKGYSKAVARGHPRPAKGEVGRAELQKMRRARNAMSPGEQRAVGIKKPVQSKLRADTHVRIASLMRIDTPSDVLDARARRDTDGQLFVSYCTQVLGMTPHEAWTLWFSP